MWRCEIYVQERLTRQHARKVALSFWFSTMMASMSSCGSVLNPVQRFSIFEDRNRFGNLLVSGLVTERRLVARFFRYHPPFVVFCVLVSFFYRDSV